MLRFRKVDDKAPTTLLRRGGRLGLFAFACAVPLAAQTALNWDQIKQRFENANPVLQAAKLGVDESRAAEITANLKPNPQGSFSTDGTQLLPSQGYYRPIAGTQYSPSVSYLHERQNKRELRLEGAKKSTEIAGTSYQDQARGLMFSLRSAFVQVLQAKAALGNARENLEYWDKELELNRTRLGAGDIAQGDLDRLELQRAQFESDYEGAIVSLRTAKIQLLNLLNDRTPVERFDVQGPYEFREMTQTLDDVRAAALATRPDLKVALESVDLAKINHDLAVANGSTDPTFSVWVTHNPSFNNPYDTNLTLGTSVSVPLRIFDRNQGEKARTQIDIGRNERLVDAARAQVFSDVDSSYVTIQSAANLLRPYRDKYLKQAGVVRDRVAFAYSQGGATLLDYLDAEKAYRDTKLAYLNLIGTFMTAEAQLNQAVGREIVQ